MGWEFQKTAKIKKFFSLVSKQIDIYTNRHTYSTVNDVCSSDLKTDTSTDKPDTDKKDKKTHRYKIEWH